MSARDEAIEMIRRVCPPHLDADEYGLILGEKFDAYRAEVLAEVTTWLVKKAREFRAMGGEMRAAQADAVAALASKVERGAVRPDNLRMLPADFFEPGHTYQRRRWFYQCLAVAPNPFNEETRAVGFLYRLGEPATVTGLDPDDWAHGGWVDVTEETNSPAEAAATPDNDTVARRAHLARAIRQGGRWKSGTVTDWYAANGYTGCDVQTARGDLTALRQADVIVQHDEPGVRYYTAARQGGDRRG